MNSFRSIARHKQKIWKILSVQISTGPNVLNNKSEDAAKTMERLHKSAAAAANEKFTLFEKIIKRELPADIIYEDDTCLAFNDKYPSAPVHFLVVPKLKIKKLDMVNDEHTQLLGHLLKTAAQLGNQKAAQGFRVVVNNGVHGCQSIYHLHLHVLGGRQLTWPPGC